MKVASIILAAGMGKRMKSPLPKVLIPIHNKPMVQWVLDALTKAGINQHCIVIGGDLEPFEGIRSHNTHATFVEQVERKGTGDAVASAYPAFETSSSAAHFMQSKHVSGDKITAEHVLICTGDAPYQDASLITDFIEKAQSSKADLAVIGMQVPDPFGYGRIVEDASGKFSSIVEEKDASDEIKKIKTCNSGVIYAKTDQLFELITRLTTKNEQKEYYLTDCFEMAVQEGLTVYVHKTDRWQNFLGVNTPDQLESLGKLMESGS